MSCEGCKERREKAAAIMREMRDSFLRKVGVVNRLPPELIVREEKEIPPPKAVDSPERGC